MSTNIFPFRDSFGTLEFTCTDCGAHVVSFCDPERDFPVCRTCQFIGEHPHLPNEVKALLRGEQR